MPDGHQVSCAKEIRLPDGPRDVNDTRDIVMALALLSGGSVSFLGCPLADYLWHVIYNHNGSIPFVGSFGLNNLGTVALFSTNFVDMKILLVNDGGLSIVSLIGTPAPTGGTIRSIVNPVMNENEALLVPFLSSSNTFGPQGLLLLSKDQTVPVAFTGSAAPGGRSFVLFPAARLEKRAMLNNREQVAFTATLDNGNSGIFRWDPDGTVTTLVQEPSSAGLQTLTLSINDRGDVAAWGLKGFFNPKQEILVIDSNGRISKVVGLNDPAPGGGTFAGVFSPIINNKGEIVFFGILSTGKSGIFLASASLEAEFVDPVPDLLADATITSDETKLAEVGRVVTGIAADGAARVVVRVKPGQPGTVEFSLVDETGAALPASNFNGSLSQVSDDVGSSSVSVEAKDVQDVGPMAFAAYHAPMDFATSPNSVEAGRSDRQVFIKVKLTTSSDETVESTESLKIVRPPVVLVHGLWGSENSWDGFDLTTNPNLFVRRVNFRGTSAAGVPVNAPKILTDIQLFIGEYKTGTQVAAVGADLVTHSMGGLIARMLPVFSSSFLRDDNFLQGDVHKLINIGTPHFGSELAERLRTKKNRSVCRFIFNSKNTPIDRGAIDDLSPGSDALKVINGFPSRILMHNNVGIASELQKQVNSTHPRITALQSFFVCGEILPPGGFDELFNDASDLLVSATSQRAGLSPSSGAVSNFPPMGPNLIHTRADGLFDVMDGEAELESPAVSSQVIQLLNLPMNSPQFISLAP